MVPETALCWNHYHAFLWKCYSHWTHLENAAQVPATNFTPFINNYFLLHVHSRTESLVLKLIPWCCSSDDVFLVVSINVSYQLFQPNLFVTLCFLYIFIHWGTNFIFQILKERIRPTWTKNRSMYISTLKLNPLNTELNPICHLLALLGAHHILHVSRIRVKWNTHIIFACVMIKKQITAKKSHHMKSWQSPVEMWWHTVTHWRGSEGETGEWSG